jgi:nuclear cap-binding protein subunit 1
MVGSIYSLDDAVSAVHKDLELCILNVVHIPGVTDGRVPDASTPKGWWMRSLMIDIIEIYEVNRIECASLLMRVPDFVLPDTFSEPPPRPPPGEPAPLPHGEWTRPSTIINVVVSSMLSLPFSSHKLVYYVGLIAQLCLLEKMEMAPPLGLAFKTLYARLGKGLDVEISKRTAEWLALHLSNFAFSWLWREWWVLIPTN